MLLLYCLISITCELLKYYLSAQFLHQMFENINHWFFEFFFVGQLFCSNDNTNEGNNIKLDNIPNNNVKATKPPKAIVPPKLDNINTENPKNKTIEV